MTLSLWHYPMTLSLWLHSVGFPELTAGHAKLD